MNGQQAKRLRRLARNQGAISHGALEPATFHPIGPVKYVNGKAHRRMIADPIRLAPDSQKALVKRLKRTHS